MQRISKIHLKNFKFFPGDISPINLEGKNILLYGENGSGKSSIYWALYTLLECANKNSPTDIQKYFDTNNPASLVNIYAPTNPQGIADSFVSITLTNGQLFQISNTETSINTSQDAKVSNFVSDFINYRLLQRTHNVKHSSEIDLFPLFEDTVIKYLQFPPVNWLYPEESVAIPIINGGEMWNIIQKGPAKNYRKKSGSSDSYPLKSKHRAAYNEFKDVVEGFYNGLNGIMARINPIANNILQAKFNINISFRLALIKTKEFSTSENQYNKPEFKINFTIDDYFGKGPVVNKPQSFLNEAKLSAISLAIRLAILEMRLPDSLIKVLLLDDLLVSLDMTNRDKVTKLFLNEYAWWKDEDEPLQADQDKGHQTIILSHDRSYFTFTKHEIENLPPNKRDTWKLIEVYADDIDPDVSGDFERPRIFDYEDEMQIAFRHYKNHDYPSAANYLRKHAEHVLCKFLPEYCWKDMNKEDKSNSKIPLNNIIDNGIAFWDLFQLDMPIYKELRKYVAILLNPLSHADVGVERYKEEIKTVDGILREIELVHKSNSYKSICNSGDTIQLRLKKPSTTDHFVAEYILKSSLYHMTFGNTTFFSSFRGRVVRCFLQDQQGQASMEHSLNGNDADMQKNYADFSNKPAINVPIDADWYKHIYNSNNIQIITVI